MNKCIVGIIFCLCPSLLFAESPAESLQLLLFKFTSLQADFVETMMVQGEKQTSTGQVWIQRPNQFRWQVNEPLAELYVSDGKDLWQYEKDLSQVTVMAVNSQLAMRSPMLLLSGKVGDVGELYTIKLAAPGRFLLTPTSADSLITSVTLQFDQGILSEFDIVNAMGQETFIHFNHVMINRPLAPSLFSFTAPANADVLRQ